MENSIFSLSGVRVTLQKRGRFIVMVSVFCAIIGGIFYLAGPKRFEAKTEFIIRNPLYGDRNNLYNYDTKFLDYFANEDDANRILLLSSSDLVQSQVIRNTHLAEAYKLDTSIPKQLFQLGRKFDKNLNVMRTEYKSLELSYSDTDPKRAAEVANECTKVLEQTFKDYYNEMRKSTIQSLRNKITEEDSTITVLTDTLVKLREQYGIFDIISPSRHNLMNGSMKESSRKNYGRGIEVVQNVESLKDEIVADRAVKTTLVNQYTTGIYNNNLSLLKVITAAKPPVNPKGIGGLPTVVVCWFLGFFFCTLIVMFREGFLEKSNTK